MELLLENLIGSINPYLLDNLKHNTPWIFRDGNIFSIKFSWKRRQLTRCYEYKISLSFSTIV